MKYRNLKISFSLGNVQFTALSISLEKLVKPIPLHSHSKNSYELHYISYGCGTLIADGQKYDITPGTLFMTGPGVSHEQISAPGDPMTEYGVYLQITPTGSFKDGPVRDFLDCTFWIGAAESAVHELMKQIFSELESRPFGFELMLPPLLQQLVLSVTRHYKRDESAPESRISSPLDPNDFLYLTIEEAFLYDYKTLTLEKLARQVHLGVRQTERLLQKHYNMTFLQKKTQARMSAACLLLQKTDKSIPAIADELGYSSPQHFAGAFKKYCHTTPGAYRRANGK